MENARFLMNSGVGGKKVKRSPVESAARDRVDSSALSVTVGACGRWVLFSTARW